MPYMASNMLRCSCGRRYRPDRFNTHHQQGCMRPACRLQRKRQRDRQRYARRYAQDGPFRAAEKARRSQCRREAKVRLRAEAAMPEPTPPGPPAEVAELRRTVTGLAAVLAGVTDGGALGEFLAACTERGRRLEPAQGLSP
jgi:hypothetical protein